MALPVDGKMQNTLFVESRPPNIGDLLGKLYSIPNQAMHCWSVRRAYETKPVWPVR
jgi:hypothetical protein